jgi:hypothetical protein
MAVLFPCLRLLNADATREDAATTAGRFEFHDAPVLLFVKYGCFVTLVPVSSVVFGFDVPITKKEY